MKLFSGSQHINVRQNTQPWFSTSGAHCGQVGFNASTQELEVFDGNRWIQISSAAELSLSFEAEEAIRWARKKMLEEQELQAKMEKYPALKDAYEQFKIVEALAYENE